MKVTIENNGKTEEFELPEETFDALTEIAERNGLSIDAALQQAIVNEDFLEQQLAAGGKLLVEKGATFRELELA